MIRKITLAIIGLATNMMAYFIGDETMGERFIACVVFVIGWGLFLYAFEEGGKSEKDNRHTKRNNPRPYFMP